MPVEALTDAVSPHLPAAPVALVMDADELQRLLEGQSRSVALVIDKDELRRLIQ